jgi:hypothetical protein
MYHSKRLLVLRTIRRWGIISIPTDFNINRLLFDRNCYGQRYEVTTVAVVASYFMEDSKQQAFTAQPPKLSRWYKYVENIYLPSVWNGRIM